MAHVCMTLWLRNLRFFYIDAPLNSPARLNNSDTNIKSLALINQILAPNSSWRFSLQLEMPREECPCPYLKESMTCKFLTFWYLLHITTYLNSYLQIWLPVHFWRPTMVLRYTFCFDPYCRNRRKTTHEALHQQLSVSLFLFFIEVRQKLTSHTYVVENGSNVKIALFSRMGNSLVVPNQKLSKGRSAKLSFKPRSYLSLVSSSCSCKIMFFPPTDAELYGSLT